MTFPCRPNCGACCGVVPIPAAVVSKNRDKFQRLVISEELIDGDIFLFTNGYCAFLDENKRCVIYEDRPEVCRFFGTSRKLPCEFIKPDGTKRTKRERNIVLNQFEKRRKSVVSSHSVGIAFPGGREHR